MHIYMYTYLCMYTIYLCRLEVYKCIYMIAKIISIDMHLYGEGSGEPDTLPSPVKSRESI